MTTPAPGLIACAHAAFGAWNEYEYSDTRNPQQLREFDKRKRDTMEALYVALQDTPKDSVIVTRSMLTGLIEWIEEWGLDGADAHLDALRQAAATQGDA